MWLFFLCDHYIYILFKKEMEFLIFAEIFYLTEIRVVKFFNIEDVIFFISNETCCLLLLFFKHTQNLMLKSYTIH